jgi:hypothetical protein
MEHLLITLVIILMIFGLAMWIIQTCPLPIPPIVKWALTAIVCIIGVFALIHATGFAV